MKIMSANVMAFQTCKTLFLIQQIVIEFAFKGELSLSAHHYTLLAVGNAFDTLTKLKDLLMLYNQNGTMVSMYEGV